MYQEQDVRLSPGIQACLKSNLMQCLVRTCLDVVFLVRIEFLRIDLCEFSFFILHWTKLYLVMFHLLQALFSISKRLNRIDFVEKGLFLVYE